MKGEAGRRHGRKMPGAEPAGEKGPAETGWGPYLLALKPSEGTQVLFAVLDGHPELLPEAESLARRLLSEGTFEGIAGDVVAALAALSPEDAWKAAGRTEFGYVEPLEAATGILEEAMGPFHEELARFLKAGFPDRARQVLMGIVLGLNRASRGKDCPVLEHAPDFAVESAGWAIEMWSLLSAPGGKGGRSRKRGAAASPLPREFVESCVPEWREFLLPGARDGRAGPGGGAPR